MKEIDTFNIDPNRVIIHERCAIIEDIDILRERDDNSFATKIASTQSGVGSALSRKINRESKLAQGSPELQSFLGELDLHYYMDQGCTVLMEVPQGFDLSISTGYAYPYCTSREITVSAALADAQVHPSYLGKVCVCLRTYPIRVGHIVKNQKELGNSGPFYPDSEETDWDTIGVDAELTTVTKRVRRVATFSMQQYKRMLNYLRPDYILMNFSNYMFDEELSVLLEETPEVSHLGFGPYIEDIKLNHIMN